MKRFILLMCLTVALITSQASAQIYEIGSAHGDTGWTLHNFSETWDSSGYLTGGGWGVYATNSDVGNAYFEKSLNFASTGYYSVTMRYFIRDSGYVMSIDGINVLGQAEYRGSLSAEPGTGGYVGKNTMGNVYLGTGNHTVRMSFNTAAGSGYGGDIFDNLDITNVAEPVDYLVQFSDRHTDTRSGFYDVWNNGAPPIDQWAEYGTSGNWLKDGIYVGVGGSYDLKIGLQERNHTLELFVDGVSQGTQIAGASGNFTENMVFSGVDLTAGQHDIKLLTTGYGSWGDVGYQLDYVKLDWVAIPEPATIALLGLGAIAFLRRKK